MMLTFSPASLPLTHHWSRVRKPGLPGTTSRWKVLSPVKVKKRGL